MAGQLALLIAPAVFTPAVQEAPTRPAWADTVDALFAAWNRPDSPGCALGVIQEGRLVHARGFGLASLEHSVPITTNTVFDLGSTSKQFTAAAIGLLTQDGKLGVEDEIHEWVDELPPWDGEVTLDHLLHHTSGIPDYTGLLTADEADVTTPEEALATLSHAQPAFAPGERFEYSNSNYFLLSLVIERASGMGFPEFARTRLFEPLGMTSTLLMHDHSLAVPHRACAYARRRGGGFRVRMSDWEQLGDGAVQSTVEDLARWDENFRHPRVGGEALQAFLHEPGTLASGERIDYARGLFVDRFLDERRVRHGGAWAGFRAELMRLPERATSIVILCNLADMDPTALAEQVAAIVLGAK